MQSSMCDCKTLACDRLVRRRVVAALKARLRAYRELLVSEQTGVVTYRFDAADRSV